MAAGYKSLDEKPYESHYLYAETLIDRPVEQVWPHALRIGTWMSAHRLETVTGEPGTVGHFERVFPRGLGQDVGQPHHHVYGVAHVIPFKYIALEVLAENGGSYGNTREWMSFDGVLLSDMGRQTKIVFLLVDVHMGRGAQGSYEQRKKELDELRKLFDQYFENLQRLVGAGA